MSESGERPDEITWEAANGDVVRVGDRVSIVRMLQDDEETVGLGITDETMARFVGTYYPVDERSGEVDFDRPAPLIEIELNDGSSKQVWGFECDWTTYDRHLSNLAEINQLIPDYPEAS